MQQVFEVCFWSGVVFTFISFILGQFTHVHGGASHGDVSFGHHGGIDTHGGVDTHGGIDANGGVHADAEASFSYISPFKPIVIASFVTVFGGVGMICTKNNFSILTGIILALVAAFITAYILFRFVVVPLYRAQNTSTLSQKAFIGELAKVTLEIKDGNFGKITYVAKGNSYSAPAKSTNGEIIERGSDVVIVDIKKNIFYVRKLKGGY